MGFESESLVSSGGRSSATKVEPKARVPSADRLRNLNYEKGREALRPKPAGTKKVKPFTVAGSGERKVYTPKTPNGKTLYFFFGYTGSDKDVSMRDEEAGDVADDVLYAAASGFKVIYDKAGTKADFVAAIHDSTCYGIYWSGHGYMNGNVQSSDGKAIGPSDIDTTRRAPAIQFLILAACGSAITAAKWKTALGPQCKFEGWVKTTTVSQTNDFTSTALVGDSWSSHEGTNTDMELRDYLSAAAEKARASK